jgi:hypothetical protein
MSVWKRISFVVVALHRCHNIHLRRLLRPEVSLIGNVSPYIIPLFIAPPCADDDMKNQSLFPNQTRGTTIG